jgi:hypothetical protein
VKQFAGTVVRPNPAGWHSSHGRGINAPRSQEANHPAAKGDGRSDFLQHMRRLDYLYVRELPEGKTRGQPGNTCVVQYSGQVIVSDGSIAHTSTDDQHGQAILLHTGRRTRLKGGRSPEWVVCV